MATCLCCFRPIQSLRCDVRARRPIADFFFGPTRGMLRDVALQLRGVWIKERWQRAARKAALLSLSEALCLKEAHARAIERLFAPGGSGFEAAHNSFQLAAQTLDDQRL